MKIKSSLRAFILTGLGLVTTSPALFAAPLTVNVTSGTTVVSDYRPADFFSPASLVQSIAMIAPPTVSINGVNNSVSLTLSAPEGHVIQVAPLAEGLDLFIDVNYVDGDATSLGSITSSMISFSDLVGTAPTLSNDLGFYPYGLLFQFRFYAVTSAFSFTSMTVTSTIDGTGANVTLNRQTVSMQAQDSNYSGPGTAPYASLISVPAAVPEPGTAILPLALGVLLFLRYQRHRKVTA